MNPAENREKILEIRDLDIAFTTDSGTVNAVRGVNLDLHQGETIAIVGESGSGKSVTTKAVMGILAGNGKIQNGSIRYTYYEFSPERIRELQKKYDGKIPEGRRCSERGRLTWLPLWPGNIAKLAKKIEKSDSAAKINPRLL